MELAKRISEAEEHIIIQARRGGVMWSYIHRMFGHEFHKWHHMRFYMLKYIWPQGLPPSGELTDRETRYHLYQKGLLKEVYIANVLADVQIPVQYAEHMSLCRQWYGIDFKPALNWRVNLKERKL